MYHRGWYPYILCRSYEHSAGSDLFGLDLKRGVAGSVYKLKPRPVCLSMYCYVPVLLLIYSTVFKNPSHFLARCCFEECPDGKCGAHGSCEVNDGVGNCLCRHGYTGENCEIKPVW